MSATGTAAGRGEAWKVGALARASGLTVRTLHHYDHIGLLSPSARTAAGHRLYTPADVARLYRITLLRSLGFPLEQIASALDDPEWQLAAAMRPHLEHTRERAAAAARLCGRLPQARHHLITPVTTVHLAHFLRSWWLILVHVARRPRPGPPRHAPAQCHARRHPGRRSRPAAAAIRSGFASSYQHKPRTYREDHRGPGTACADRASGPAASAAWPPTPGLNGHLCWLTGRRTAGSE
ncbi:MerR family transcriptional regulator [Trebonia sp.]|uniref:MerR family transcriptional regulator n=1 Tax=Trebonia sp. TaxID=2767075 RepID=UPI00261C75C4|nr:MerR family transcriptional regulator [Trebonia sp.]